MRYYWLELIFFVLVIKVAEDDENALGNEWYSVGAWRMVKEGG